MSKDMKNLVELARSARINALKCVYCKTASHIGSGFSCADLLVYLYAKHLNISPVSSDSADRDRFILSKGHAAAIYYAVLAKFGFFPEEWLEKYCDNGSPLGGHIHYHVPGVELSTGSLGHGLPVAVGMAMAAKRFNKNYKVVVLLSDGEMEEGSNWEALNMAAAQGLDNLTVIVDKNGLQAMGFTKDILPMENLAERVKSFGCDVQVIDGHDFKKMDKVFSSVPWKKDNPSMIIAETIKGKGVSFMENTLEWHYKSPNDEQFQQALTELETA